MPRMPNLLEQFVMRLLKNLIVTFNVYSHFTPMGCFDSFLMLFKSHFIRETLHKRRSEERFPNFE
ncbi:hypothetical protein AUQ44_01125 [Vibrio cidicii]|uniref:Uncharacterized protein n=1 Tax=Vibrio cidicii TaxID=1763883 RepID=A0A151JFJ3_9VIBR|nr:hypothetical protein AUQ44_01125 [Vibrio cidicii]